MVDLKKICKSTINLKIISFFHENRSVVDTSRGIAAWLNYSREETKKALDYLTRQKILIAEHTGSATAYAYTQDKKIIETIEKLLNGIGK